MLAAAQEKAKQAGESDSLPAPPMSSWSAEVEAITRLTDKVAYQTYVLKKVNNDKAAQPPKPEPRPQTLLPRILRKRRQERHQALADRLL
jgi:hypothetical protein